MYVAVRPGHSAEMLRDAEHKLTKQKLRRTTVVNACLASALKLCALATRCVKLLMRALQQCTCRDQGLTRTGALHSAGTVNLCWQPMPFTTGLSRLKLEKRAYQGQ